MNQSKKLESSLQASQKRGWKWARKIARIYQKSDRFFHLLVGMPSYDKYLEYMQKYHPFCTPKTRAEFFREAQDKRYGGGASRCC